METNTSELMAGLTLFATADELATAEQAEINSPTTTVFTITTTNTWVADSDDA